MPRPPEPPPPRPYVPGQGHGNADPVLAVEALVDRVARLVLHAHALAERMTVAPGSRTLPGRDERVRRLLEAVELGRRGLDAAATRPPAAVPGLVERRTVERRRADPGPAGQTPTAENPPST